MTGIKSLAVAVLCATVTLLAVMLVSGPASAYPAKSPASISISPAHPQCGKNVTIDGHHYKPGEAVTIKVNGFTEARTRADGSGDWSVTFPLNCHGADAATITATGAGGDVDSLTVSMSGTHGGGSAHGPDALGSGPHSGGSGTNGSGTAGLSSTGVAVLGIGIISVMLMLVGGVLLVASKRRRTA